MKIKSFEIENYKCFHGAQRQNIGDTFNIIIGQNNSGKTALLEALSLNFENLPHRGMNTLPERGRRISENVSKCKVVVEIGYSEIQEVISSTEEEIYVDGSNQSALREFSEKLRQSQETEKFTLVLQALPDEKSEKIAYADFEIFENSKPWTYQKPEREGQPYQLSQSLDDQTRDFAEASRSFVYSWKKFESGYNRNRLSFTTHSRKQGYS